MESLQEAILSQNLLKVKELLIENPSRIDEVDEDGIAMTFLAAKTGAIDLIKYIVEYSRASLNIVDERNRNTLHYATMSGNLETVQYLVEKVGLSPVVGDFELETPFDIAVNMDYKDIIEYYENYVGSKYSNMYRNPIRTGMYPDPSIVRVGEDYYMANSSFIFFPSIPISHSKDLIHWRIIGHAITNPEWAMLEGLEGGRGFWAPDISYYKGKFYVAATYRLNDDGNIYRKQFIMSSERPEGPYSKPSVIDEDGIDPSIFNDDDGRRYMLLNRGARIFELDDKATKQISKAELLYYGDFKRAPEGPHLLKKDGYYYLFEAEGGTGEGHRITVSRSKSLKGNYEPCPYNPIMRQNDSNAGIQRCGHGKPVQTQNGEWYMVYLCGRRIGKGYSILGRETALDPITWTADGWPLVNNLKGPSTLQIKPNLPEMIWESSTEDDFESNNLSKEWMFPRPPMADGCRCKDSHLIIKASAVDLDSMYARNIVLRRQQDFQFSVECKMKLPQLKDGEDAGITCFYDENTFLKFAVFNQNERKAVAVKQHIGELDKIEQPYEITTEADYIFFKIETDYLQRVFYYSFDGKKYYKYLELDDVYYLCDEGLQKGKRFTGAMVGMYAHAKDLEVEFDYFNYNVKGKRKKGNDE